MSLRRRPRVLERLVRRAEPATPAEGPKKAIVSLTFDDGLASQRLAAELLAERGLMGTFYVSSGLVGRAGRLGWDDLRTLAAQGHEVGGHTSTHARLPALDAGAARHEIESDRHVLLECDLDPVTFAYPYGEATTELESIVGGVGYTAARGIGGIVESIPPENGFRLRTPHSTRSWTTLEQLAALVLTADHEGGWMILPFHHLAPEGSVSSNYTTEPAQFEEFLDWLAAREVRVVRVRDAVSGALPA